jgi:hypothetical protein
MIMMMMMMMMIYKWHCKKGVSAPWRSMLPVVHSQSESSYQSLWPGGGVKPRSVQPACISAETPSFQTDSEYVLSRACLGKRFFESSENGA